MKVGDLVKLKVEGANRAHGRMCETFYGVVLEFVELNNAENDIVGVRDGWAFVMWPHEGKSLEKIADLEVINEGG